MSHQYYERHLPHYHPPGAVLFLTARLAGSLPQAVVQQLRAELALACKPVSGEEPVLARERVLAAQREHFGKLEKHLEHSHYGPTWLRYPRVATLVLDGLHHQHQQQLYALMAACVMPNHLHAVVRLPETLPVPFFRILQRWKSATALQCNRLLNRTGAFWQPETYDHVVRGAHEDAAVAQVVRYCLLNPVKAGLCSRWADWPATYLAPEWQEALSTL